jgi:hypothetical protein
MFHPNRIVDMPARAGVIGKSLGTASVRLGRPARHPGHEFSPLHTSHTKPHSSAMASKGTAKTPLQRCSDKFNAENVDFVWIQWILMHGVLETADKDPSAASNLKNGG